MAMKYQLKLTKGNNTRYLRNGLGRVTWRDPGLADAEAMRRRDMGYRTKVIAVIESTE